MQDLPAVNEFDVLLVMAQLSVAFAGFASLASAFSQRNPQAEMRVDAGRLINMLIVSLCTAMLTLVPVIPALFGGTEDFVWRSSAAIAFGTMVAFAPGLMKRATRMRQYAGFNHLVNIANLVIAGIAACSFILCAFGLPAHKPSASYFTGLVSLMLVCAVLFYRVIASLLRPHAPE